MISVDSIPYDLPILTISRSFTALDKSAERTQDGNLHRELIGVYINFDITLGMSDYNQADYIALFNVISSAVEFHTFQIPGEYDDTAWEAYVSNGKDEVIKLEKDGQNYYRGLSFSVIARKPLRTP